MTLKTRQTLLLVAAIFNWVVGLSLFFVPDLFLSLLQVEPLTGRAFWLQQFAGLVFIFGLGYFWAARDFHGNRSIVRLAVLAKTGVAAIALINVVDGKINWPIMIPASADVIFACLFITALSYSDDSDTVDTQPA